MKLKQSKQSLMLIEVEQCQTVASALKMCPEKCSFAKYARGPIYRKLYAVWKEEVRSIAGHALYHSAQCA
jgi:hypothetical protein